MTTLVDAAAFGLSDGAFLPTIQSQGTDEQREKWVPLIRDYRVIGAYAQTEMGHGKNECFLFVTVTVTVKVYWFLYGQASSVQYFSQLIF